ncbi:MAG: tRNA (adenosine(37)-N6)-threonylcarbamoyltransferase complex dimerization subunit type 1 TsaB [Actinomycetota bacterium]|nr:tRNA (adenosine(37)-N6)-threonylcarbamoyltransferase complex dimerization subunit type 1 TsaB [Actinomycetota bacterium]
MGTGMRDGSRWILALDFSTPVGLVCLKGPEPLLSVEIDGRSRASQVFTAVRRVMDGAGLRPCNIGTIGVGRGPGSFTGVRVAVMAAKALAHVLQIPLVAPDSLEVLAMSAVEEADYVTPVLDARRGEVYTAFYRVDEGYPVSLNGPEAVSPQLAADMIRCRQEQYGGNIAILGSGVKAYPLVWPEGIVRMDKATFSPHGLTRLCVRYAESELTVDPLQLLPLYVRKPDAKPRFAGGDNGGIDAAVIAYDPE